MSTTLGWMNSRRRQIGFALVVIGLALLVFKAWRVVATARSLQSRLAQAQALAQSANSKIDADAIGSLVLGARSDVQSLRADIGPLLGIAPRLGWLPGVGGDVQAAPALLNMADGLTEAGVLVWQSMSPLVESWGAFDGQTSLDLPQKALAQLIEARPQIEQVKNALAQAAQARASIQPDRLSPRLSSQVRKLDQLLPLAQVSVDTALGAPEALGLNGPRRYLILAQNEDELRPTGGFISSAGRATFDQGRLIELSFMDANIVDDLTRPYPDLPEPMAHYMGLGQMNELWLFRDSNWSPDFPTSARQAAHLYTYGQKMPVDGVVAVDQRAVQMLIAVIEPLNVPFTNSQVIVTRDNIIDIMREVWNPPGGKATAEWMMARKGFIAQFAAAIKTRIERDPSQVPWAALGRAMLRALDERHMLAYMTQPDLAAAFARPGWDGTIRQATGDYLMVVDTNMGYNKANAVVTQRLHYTVTLTRDGGGRAVVELDYHHSGLPGLPCQQDESREPQITYQSMFNRCYYDYLRVYAPPGAQLLDSSQQQIPASYFLSRQPVNSRAETLETEAGKSVFAIMFVVETGQNRRTYLTYQLPPGVVRRKNNEWHYSLWIQKQPGQSAIPTTMTVNLPPGTRTVATTPAARAVVAQGEQLRFEFALAQDTYLEVQYRDRE